MGLTHFDALFDLAGIPIVSQYDWSVPEFGWRQARWSLQAIASYSLIRISRKLLRIYVIDQGAHFYNCLQNSQNSCTEPDELQDVLQWIPLIWNNVPMTKSPP